MSKQTNPQSPSHILRFVSVKDKISEARTLLPSHLSLSEKPKHLLSQSTLDIQSQGFSHSYLDFNCQRHTKNNSLSHQLFKEYGNDLNSLFKATSKIVFMSSAAQERHFSLLSQKAEDTLTSRFGSVKTQNLQNQQAKNKNNVSTNNKNWIQKNGSQIEFGEDFQSSNIYMALKQNEWSYLVTMRLDYNTYSYGQWFYFRMKNSSQSQRSKKFRIAIVNMTKTSSMFGKGLKVSVCRNKIWRKEGQDISYQPNCFKRNPNTIPSSAASLIGTEPYYTLCFTVSIKGGQEIYVAYNQPYTCTRLGKTIDKILLNSHDNNEVTISRSILGRTILGNCIEVLSITLPDANGRKIIEQRKIIVITARTHPVQSAGSFVMEGIIEQLCKPDLNLHIYHLLERYIFKIIPMMNPDGVIVGNSRCNIKGYDLNRRWNRPNPQKTPEVQSILKMIMKYQNKIEMFIDLHGHSKKKNVFAYGCHDVSEPFATREFPFLLSKINKEDFLFKQCRFTVPPLKKKTEKDGTARMTLWKKLKIHNIFTIQNSYCSAQGSAYHYDQASYKAIGRSILEGMSIYFVQDQTNQCENLTNYSDSLTQHRKCINKAQLLKQLRKDDKNVTVGLLDAEQSQSELQQRMQADINQEKSPLPQSRQKKKFNSLASRINKNKMKTLEHESLVLVNKKNRLLKPKPQNQTMIFKSRSRKLQSMIELKKLAFGSSIPKSESQSNNESKKASLGKNILPVRKQGIRMTRVGGYPINMVKSNNARSVKSIYLRNQQEDLQKNSSTMLTLQHKGNVLSILDFSSRRGFLDAQQPNSEKNSNKKKNMLFPVQDKRTLQLILVDQGKRIESNGANHITKALQRSNNHAKLNDLVIKIHKNIGLEGHRNF